MDKKLLKSREDFIKWKNYYGNDDYYSLRIALFDTRSMLRMCSEKLREIKNQIKKCNREFEMN